MNNKISVSVYATTTLRSGSGKEYPYTLRMKLNTVTWQVRVIEESTCRMYLRPYQLLHLMEKVFRTIAPDLLEGDRVAVYEKIRILGDRKEHPALISYLHWYRLDVGVKGKWVESPGLIQMVRALVHLKNDRSACPEAYRMLKPDTPYPWEVQIQ